MNIGAEKRMNINALISDWTVCALLLLGKDVKMLKLLNKNSVKCDIINGIKKYML